MMPDEPKTDPSVEVPGAGILEADEEMVRALARLESTTTDKDLKDAVLRLDYMLSKRRRRMGLAPLRVERG